MLSPLGLGTVTTDRRHPGTLDELVRAGKIREIGCSKFTEAQLREADAAAVGARFTVVRNQCSLLHPDDERDVLPACAELGIGYVAYWPLARDRAGGGVRDRLTGRSGVGRSLPPIRGLSPL